ncbi:MAG: DUF2270 domain-containing protein, partial [Rhodobacteraceae bacterium]|nr:DUF2270 domain-containing protein [Paracoccaceae bacterium]
LALEARRYRYFNVWRARTRWLEKNFYEPLLLGQADKSMEWRKVLADDYHSPRYHVGYLTSMARRIRRNYLWISLIQALAFCGKLMVHPGPVASWAEFADRADIGPLPGEVILAIGALYCATWAGLAVWVVRADARRHLKRTGPADAMG